MHKSNKWLSSQCTCNAERCPAQKELCQNLSVWCDSMQHMQTICMQHLSFQDLWTAQHMQFETSEAKDVHLADSCVVGVHKDDLVVLVG